MSPLSPEETQSNLAALRPRLLGFARLQLRSAAAAEDVVQDALLAAVEGAYKFSGAASFQTWVFSILKNKIIDELRRSSRTQADVDAEEALDEAVAELFDQREHWVEMPPAWGDPQASLEQKRFWDVLDACLTILPASPARVFMMREFLGLETAEICKELSISTSNCWVLLHRARIGLRECLGLRWFGESNG
jgi:RNA polymerase sigma-70 factor (ECF subfamily)